MDKPKVKLPAAKASDLQRLHCLVFGPKGQADTFQMVWGNQDDL